MYVPGVTLSRKNDKKLLEQLTSGFKTTVKWKKYKSQLPIQPQKNNLKYLIDPTFTKVSRLFVLSFVRTAEGDHRDSLSNYYVPNVRIKHFNVLIDEKSFFNLPLKMKKKPTKKLWAWIEIMATQPVLYWILLISKKKYKLISIDLRKQTNLKDPQQSSFIGRLLAAAIFFIIEKSEETIFEFLQNYVNIIYKWKHKRL